MPGETATEKMLNIKKGRNLAEKVAMHKGFRCSTIKQPAQVVNASKSRRL